MNIGSQHIASPFGESAAPLPAGAEAFRHGHAPLVIHWELTRACDLACVHCRAEAVRHRHPEELTTDEGRALLRDIAGFGERRLPHLVITGGDPLRRPDILELIRYARSLDISVSVTPAGTPRLTPNVISRLKDAGVSSLAISLDGSRAETHDAFRQVPGSYKWTRQILKFASAQGVPLQVNTMVTAQTVDEIPAIFEQLQDSPISRWVLFFLITTGRGQMLEEIAPDESLRLLSWLAGIAGLPRAPFRIKTTEAPHFRWIYYQQQRDRGAGPEQVCTGSVGRGFGVRDGNGVVFVSHKGEVYPSGFLPLEVGSVRKDSLVDIYRRAPLMRKLRDPDSLTGKCGTCPARPICGGSRARAYASAGDPFASDPLCPYGAEAS